MVSWWWERWGGVKSAIEVAMVSMASDGAPTGVMRRLSTEEIFFCVVMLSTKIVYNTARKLLEQI